MTQYVVIFYANINALYKQRHHFYSQNILSNQNKIKTNYIHRNRRANSRSLRARVPYQLEPPPRAASSATPPLFFSAPAPGLMS